MALKSRPNNDVDSGHSWVVLAGASVGMTLLALAYCGGVFNIMFLDVFGKSKQQTAWLTATQSSLWSLGGPLSSVLTNRLGPRWTTIAGGIVGSLGYILTFFANGYTYAFITFSLMSGLGLGICYVPLIAIPSMYFDKRRNLAYGLTTTAVAVGTVLLPMMCLMCRDYFGWRGTMLILGGLYMHQIVAGAMFKRTSASLEDEDSSDLCSDTNDESKTVYSVCDVQVPSENDLMIEKDKTASGFETVCDIQVPNENDLMIEKDKAINGFETTSIAHGISFQTINKCRNKHSLSFMANPPFICLCVSLFAVNAASFTCYIHFPAYFVSKGATSTNIATCFLALGLCNIACRLIAGIATNSKDIEVLLVYMSSCGLTGVLMFMCPLMANSPMGRVAFAALFGFYGNWCYSMLAPITIDILSVDELPMAYGVESFFGGVGGLLGPPCAGLLYDLTGSYVYSFYTSGVVFIVSAAVIMLVPILTPKQSTPVVVSVDV